MIRIMSGTARMPYNHRVSFRTLAMSHPHTASPDNPSRRHWLAAGAACGGALLAPAIARARELLPAPKNRRVVIVGGGWGGLSTARHLREQAPGLDVVVIERTSAFWSHPQSNKWLVGLDGGTTLTHDRQTAAEAFGYALLHAEVIAIDRDNRQVVTAQGTVAYDWLVLATGVRYDYTPWFGNDRRAADFARRNYPPAFIGAEEALALKRKLEAFTGGDLLMTVPPMPYRCPPAPFERACMIGWWLKTRKIRGRLIVLDPNPPALGFDRIFRQHYADQIVYVPQATVKTLDPFSKRISTDFDTFDFTDAILMPPQQASDLAWQAALIGRDASGAPSGWAAQDPLRLQSLSDERIWLVGDLIDRASFLFGHYPKSGHLANRLGRIAAGQIAARAHDKPLTPGLPDSVCYVHAKVEPLEMIRIDTAFRLRGDGVIMQTVKQHYDPNPRGEDAAWAAGMYAEFLAAPR